MRQKGKRAFVTGANGALAKQTIIQLLQKGVTEVVMAVRSELKGEKARREILAGSQLQDEGALTLLSGVDMLNPSKMETALHRLRNERPFDIVFLAAGFAVFDSDYQGVNYRSKRFEKTVFQNIIGGHFVYRTLDTLGLVSKGARIVFAGGEGARGIFGMIRKPQFDTVRNFQNYLCLESNALPNYDPMNALGVSKFVGALWIRYMSKKENKERSFIWFSPGMTAGSVSIAQLPRLKRNVFRLLFTIMKYLGVAQSPQRGGEKFAQCLLGIVGVNGAILGAPKGKVLGRFTNQIPLNTQIEDTGLQQALMELLDGAVAKRESKQKNSVLRRSTPPLK